MLLLPFFIFVSPQRSFIIVFVEDPSSWLKLTKSLKSWSNLLKLHHRLIVMGLRMTVIETLKGLGLMKFEIIKVLWGFLGRMSIDWRWFAITVARWVHCCKTNSYIQEGWGFDENYGRPSVGEYGKVYRFRDSMNELGPIAYDLRFGSGNRIGKQYMQSIWMGFKVRNLLILFMVKFKVL